MAVQVLYSTLLPTLADLVEVTSSTALFRVIYMPGYLCVRWQVDTH